MTRRLVAIAATVLMMGTTVLAGTTSPAEANSGSTKYARHDSIPAAIDLLRLKVDNGDKRVTMSVRVRDLKRRGEFEFYYWRGGTATPPPQSVLITVRWVDGGPLAKFQPCDTEVCEPAPCAGVTADWRPRADVVTVSMPQRCYPRAEGTPPPTVGRFFAGSSLGDEFDPGNEGILRLKRG